MMASDDTGGQPPSEREMKRLQEGQSRFARQLLRIRGVHGVGIGYKKTDGKTTDQLALIVRVDHKLPQSEVDPREFIPPEYRFRSRDSDKEEAVVLTDVQERPRPVEYTCIADGALEARVRPIPGGYSIGRVGMGGGTLGGWVWDDLNDQVVLLTNQHVLGSTVGTDVLQPSDSDGGVFPADHFADVVRSGTLDATIAAPININDVQYEIAGIGPAVYEVVPATLNMLVEKSGQTTEHTTGRVVMVNYVSNHYGSTNDFEVDPDPGIPRFAYYGDSGSLIVERTHPSGSDWKRVVGLLWGGDPSVGNAYAHQLPDVFADLNLTTVCAGAFEEVLDGLFGTSYSEFGEQPRIPPPFERGTVHRAARRMPRGFYDGIARDFEKRLASTKRGQAVIDVVHAHRVHIVEMLRNDDIRRALVASTAPFVQGAWTTDEVFNRVVTDEDAERFKRLFRAVEERQPEIRELLRFAAKVLDDARANRLAEVLE